MTVSVLFARADSCYFDLANDVWSESRDARRYQGPGPVVAHPPCRGWGRFSHVAKAGDDEKALGLFAVSAVRRWGGVLEHPHASKLWKAAGLPPVGFLDTYGGFTLLLDQGWFGHPAPKPTWLYCCGLGRHDVPEIPVKPFRAKGQTVKLAASDRERTPREFALWLLCTAGRARPSLGVVGGVA